VSIGHRIELELESEGEPGVPAGESGCVHFAKSSWKVTVALFVGIW
jgi:hypothetical protein